LNFGVYNPSPEPSETPPVISLSRKMSDTKTLEKAEVTNNELSYSLDRDEQTSIEL